MVSHEAYMRQMRKLSTVLIEELKGNIYLIDLGVEGRVNSKLLFNPLND